MISANATIKMVHVVLMLILYSKPFIALRSLQAWVIGNWEVIIWKAMEFGVP